MNFAPYHAFGACEKLEKQVAALKTAGKVPDDLFRAHEKYHTSLVHKLRSARYHADTLAQYLATVDGPQTDPSEIVYRVNFHFDGFLHVLGSATDIFAREVLTYFGIPHPARVYYHTAREQITALRPGDAVLPFLDDPSWKAEFSDYRNTATHERLIAAGYTIQYDVSGKSAITRIVFPIPDDPRAEQPTTKRNQDITEYCGATFRRAVSHFNKTYTHLASRISAAGSLPL